MNNRETVIAEAMTWKRTPFVWNACIKGVGVDCGRFLAGVFNASGLKQIDIASFPEMSAQWFLHKDESEPSPFITQIERFAVEYQLAPGRIPQPADLVIAKCGRDWSHSALVVAWPRVIASANGFCVTEWRDIHKSPQYGTRALRFFDPFAPGAGGNV